jgi:4-hydroxy-tetrahydrodipicolinate synthase
MSTYEVFTGVIPAALMPFDADFGIDEANYRRHLRYLAETDGVTGITVNGDAAEVSSLSFEDQKRSVEIAVDEVGDLVRIICGVADPSTAAAIRTAKMAEAAGAHGLLVFPSNVFTLGMKHRPEVAYEFYGAIAKAVSLPLVLFIDAAGSEKTLPAGMIRELCIRNENITGIKDWSVEILANEANLKAIRSVPRKVSMLTSFSRALLPSLSLGADGIISGSGSMIADLQVALLRAVEGGDLKAARAVADRIYTVTQVIYANPVLDQHNRMKEALVILGRIDAAQVRGPLLRISDAERQLIVDAVAAAGLPTGGKHAEQLAVA